MSNSTQMTLIADATTAEDPGTGSARFLTAASRALSEASLVGVEIDPAGRADRLRGLGLDQFLEHQGHRVTHQLCVPLARKASHSSSVAESERVIGVSSSMSR